MIIGIVSALVTLGLDQLSKFLVYGTPARSIIGNFLWFNSTLNTGVAFSLFTNASVFFAVLSGVASVVFAWLILSKRVFGKKLQKLSLGLILGGTFSNFLDRLIFGGVRDFIYLKFINFAIFNVADMAVVCGAILLCVVIIVDFIKDLKSSKAEESQKVKEND